MISSAANQATALRPPDPGIIQDLEMATKEQERSTPSYASIMSGKAVNGSPSRAYRLMEASMERTVVLKLLGKNIGLNALSNKTFTLWKPSQPFNLMDLENGYLLAKFQNDEDYEKDTCNRRRFARVVVFIDLNQPLVTRIMAWIPLICFSCGRFEHLQEACTFIKKSTMHGSETVMSGDIHKPETAVNTEVTASSISISGADENPQRENNPYGPWITVERRRRRTQGGGGNGKKGSPKESKSHGSRFAALDENTNGKDMAALDENDNDKDMATPNHGDTITNEKEQFTREI
ncbi:hypothetical protein F3Y22_tig00117056pilonHSYRG00680 [Hibiscus syriacus]|uniref:DUF4283 domain-containing protein n=1 Tax=Hibiscus syriacus TaxID=106335 RepID=A0A6A2XJP2_HIBSY|nr:hypothetical protein F3Y22_tig00117056pilonHSYRG00680 [Hibiscus syriacus]